VVLLREEGGVYHWSRLRHSDLVRMHKAVFMEYLGGYSKLDIGLLDPN
jgi:hypothetical protein